VINPNHKYFAHQLICSVVSVALRATKPFARVRSDTHATCAGRSKRAAATAVSNDFSAYRPTDILLCTGRHHTRTATVKEEPASPAKPAAKRKVYSTSGTNPIGSIELFAEADMSQGIPKRHKAGAGGTAHVRFDSAATTSNTRPAPKPTRRSTRAAKTNPKVEDNSKLDVSELFERLGQEFHAIAKTCETIAEAINSNA
jgi:hypothetical protein